MLFALKVVDRNTSIICFNVTISVKPILAKRTLNGAFLFMEYAIDGLIMMKPALQNLARKMCNLSRALSKIVHEISFIGTSVFECINPVALLFAL
jgi:hypothetical protein